MDEIERRIAERAYHLWEQEGRKPGHADEHWERARFLVGVESNPHAGELPNPSIPTVQNPSGTAPAYPPAEPLREAVENLGEFPGQADQGEKAQAPVTPPQRQADLPHQAAQVDLTRRRGSGR